MIKVLLESDLAKLYENWDLQLALDNPEALESVLWQQGIDVGLRWYTEDGKTSRDASGKLTDSIRFIGRERTDAEWKQSGRMSMEALFADSEYDLQMDLQQLLGSNTFNTLDTVQAEQFFQALEAKAMEPDEEER